MDEVVRVRSRGARGLRVLIAALMLTVSAGVMGLASSSSAEAQGTTQTVNFSIPAGPLSRALAVFGRQSGLQVTYLTSIAAGKSSLGFSGPGTRRQALARILEGSGLSYSFPNETTAAITGPGTGNNATATVDGAIALDTIDVSGSGGAAAADRPYQTPGSSAYISAEQINRVPPTSPGDIFKSTPGVISAGNRNGASIDINIRGLQGANRVNVTVDGTQQTTSSYRGYGGHDNRVYIDPELLSGIEIEKGPSGGPHGAGFIGGIVNLRTLEAGDVIRDGQGVGLRLSGTIGSNTDDMPATGTSIPRTDGSDSLGFGSKTGSIAAAAASENVEFVIAAARRKSGNYYAGSNGPTTTTMSGTTVSLSPFKPGEEVFNTAQDTTSALVKGKFKFLDGHAVELGYIHYDGQYGEAWPDLIRFGIKQQALLAHTTTHTFTSRYAYKPADSKWVDFHVDVWATDGKTDLAPLYTTNGSQTTGGEIWNQSLLSTALGELNLKYGVSYAREEFKSTEMLMTASMDGTRTIGSAFNSAALDVTSWLRVAGSVRYDTYEIAGTGDANIYGATGDADFADDGNRISPTASVTVTPWRGVQLFAQYANGWRPPTIREIVGITGSIKPNPNLRPETAENYEIGANTMHTSVLKPDDKLRTKIAYFDNRYEDYIVRSYSSLYGVTGVPYTWANIPQAHFKGIEAQVSYDGGYLFTEASFTYYTNATYCFGETSAAPTCQNTTSGVDYGSSFVPPKYAGSVTIGGRFFDQALTIGSRVTFAGKRAADAAVPSTTLPYVWAPYAIVDIFGSYKLTDEATLHLSVENVADRYYIDALGNSYMPAPGRTIRANLTLRF